MIAAPPKPVGPQIATVVRPQLSTFRLQLRDGATTTLHVLRVEHGTLRPRLVVMPETERLGSWCLRNAARYAVIGGFFVRPEGTPLGELRSDGVSLPSRAFEKPWDGVRSCVHIEDGRVRIARRHQICAEPRGDLLQAGPLLVRDGLRAISADHDTEGFSTASHQFDSDITIGRYPRAALAINARGDLLAAVCEGRSDFEAGLTLTELARALVSLGAREAINLDGGGSASLVCEGHLVNTPREEHGIELPGGRPLSTALVFEPA